jgi:hypothetical protein
VVDVDDVRTAPEFGSTRVWFGDSFHPRDEIADSLSRLGAPLEWSSVNLLALDAADESHAQELADFLDDRQRQGSCFTRPDVPPA